MSLVTPFPLEDKRLRSNSGLHLAGLATIGKFDAYSLNGRNDLN
jgi:hypothetical protein